MNQKLEHYIVLIINPFLKKGKAFLGDQYQIEYTIKFIYNITKYIWVLNPLI